MRATRDAVLATVLGSTLVTGLALGCREAGTSAGPAPERLVAALTGASERPVAVSTGATGGAVFDVSATKVDYTINVAGLDMITAAHIHLGGPAVAGPVAVQLYANATGTGTVTGQLTSGSFTAAQIQVTGLTLDSLTRLLRTGLAYVNVHTRSLPGGAIRGQVIPPGGTLPPERFEAPLSGASERPTPNGSTAAGIAAFEVRGSNIAYVVTITRAIDSVTSGHIHRGDNTIAGPVAVDLAPSATALSFAGDLKRGTFTPSNVIASSGVPTMDSLLVLMRNGNAAYANFHTRKFPGGEIRGQIVPVTTTSVPVP